MPHSCRTAKAYSSAALPKLRTCAAKPFEPRTRREAAYCGVVRWGQVRSEEALEEVRGGFSGGQRRLEERCKVWLSLIRSTLILLLPVAARTTKRFAYIV